MKLQLNSHNTTNPPAQLAADVQRVADDLTSVLTKARELGYSQRWISIGAADIEKGLKVIEIGLLGLAADMAPQPT